MFGYFLKLVFLNQPEPILIALVLNLHDINYPFASMIVDVDNEARFSRYLVEDSIA